MGTAQASPGLPGTCVAALCDLRVVFDLEPAGDAARLTLPINVAPPLGRLGRVLDRLVLHRVVLASQRRSLARLAAILNDEPGQRG
jgi:hypothetical protein